MEKHWLKSYPPGVRPEININEYSSLKEMIEKALAIHATRDAYVNMGTAAARNVRSVLEGVEPSAIA